MNYIWSSWDGPVLVSIKFCKILKTDTNATFEQEIMNPSVPSETETQTA